MGSELTIFTVAFLANVLLGLLVYISNPRSWSNRLFFLNISTMNVWALVNVISSRSTGNVFAARFVLFWAVAFAFLFYLFAHTYPKMKLNIPRKSLLRFSLWCLFIMALTLSPFVFKDVIAGGGGVGQPVVAPGIGLFALTTLGFDGAGLFLLAKKIRVAKKSERLQRLYLFVGFAVMKVTIIVLNFILPSAFKDTRFIPYASVFMLPFVLFTTYAIVKHQLLDIRATVARAVAYLLSLGSLGLVYGGIIYGVSNLLSGTSWYGNYQRVFYIGLALITSLAYENILRFFNKATNKIFYQDAYDTQVLIDRLNYVIVGNVFLRPLLRGCAEIIADTLKTEYCSFIISKTTEKPYRSVGNRFEPFDELYMQAVCDYALFSSKIVTSAEEVSVDHASAGRLLKQGRIDLMGRISTSSELKDLLGYLVIGSKKSGNPFNNQDKKAIEIITNELTIAIQNVMRFEEIQAFNVTLQARVNEATHQLQLANEKLISLNDTKDDFISMASHQLRTPLTAVKGNISMIMDEDFGKIPKTIRDPLNQAFASSERMVGLIADLLNVSRLRTGKFAIQPVPSNLDAMVKSELRQLKESAASRHLTLTYDSPEDFPTLMLDEIKIRQVIMNFADNAIYYTPAGGHINVTLRQTAKQIEFTVVDDGIGVPRDLQRHLFTKFYRAANAQKMRPDGTGIGLFMAKKVIIASGGSLIYKSIEGKGSTFGFSIPMSKLAKSPTSNAHKN